MTDHIPPATGERMAQTDGPLPALAAEQPEHHAVGPLSFVLLDGDLRRVTFHGIEVLRRLSCPIRDASWGTLVVEETEAALTQRADGFTYLRRFVTADTSCSGVLTVTAQVTADSAEIAASIVLQPRHEITVNRAGFTLLHPLRGVSDAPITVLHPDGSVTETRLPRRISAGQPARQMAGLRQVIDGVAVDISFSGEVFEMEDQRNWSDASFKTYCRPLSDPRPYRLTEATPVTQGIVLRLSDRPAASVSTAIPTETQGRMPQVGLAHEPGLSSVPALARFPDLPLAARIDAATDAAELAVLAARRNLTLEIVVTDTRELSQIAGRCRTAGLAPDRVIALPRGYLASHQPEGPWPKGDTPMHLVAPLRQTFATAAIGGGSLTNFTEFNRCPPDAAAVDFVTFGNTAIVHAADDMSVLETLETLPHIFASVAVLADGKPLRLGLVSIGMRSNPYGAGVVPNPGRQRMPMAADDPRQATGFAAAYAIGVLAAAAGHGVAALALGMADGPLGITAGAALTPLGEVTDLAAGMSGENVVIIDDAGLVSVTGANGGLIANLGADARTTPTPHPLRIFGAARPRTAPAGAVLLQPTEAALWRAGRA
jgi:hypothetical protein